MLAYKLIHYILLILIAALIAIPGITNHVSLDLELTVYLGNLKIPVVLLVLLVFFFKNWDDEC